MAGKDQTVEKIYPYDAAFYDRKFMNCGQRQAIVLLEKKKVPVNLLFYNSFSSSDSILRQIIVEKKQKYAFASDFYSPKDLKTIGVWIETINADSFDRIVPTLDEHIRREGFALISGDVFYFPHCPEYKARHTSHIAVLQGKDRDDDWKVIDDNPASILCEYIYYFHTVRQFFENNVARKAKFIHTSAEATREAAMREIERDFQAAMRNWRDSYLLYDEIDDVIRNPFDSAEIKMRTLHDSFTLLSGSRSCFRKFLEEIGIEGAAVGKSQEFADIAFSLKSLAVKWQITGKMNIDGVMKYCKSLKQLDIEIRENLRMRWGEAA